MNEVTKVLVDALKLFGDGEGWSNGSLHERSNGQDKYCAMGAISKAAEGKVRDVGRGEKVADQAAKLLASTIRAHSTYSYSSYIRLDVEERIPTWNDKEGRGFRTIKEGFCRAIKKSMETDTKPKHRTVRKPASKAKRVKRAA